MTRRKIDSVIETCLDLSGQRLRLPESADFAEQRAAWQVLWEQHMTGNGRDAASVSLAVMLTSLGAYIAMQQREYQTAFDGVAAFTSHPQWAQVEHTYRVSLSGDQFFCLLCLDRQEQALQVAAEMLQAERRSDIYTSVLQLQGQISMFCRMRDENACVPEPFAALICDIFERRVRKRLIPLPQPIQYGVLRTWMDNILDTARAAEERARQRRIQRVASRKAQNATLAENT